MFSHIFFDLDGTLTDSSEGILNSFCYAIDRMGLKKVERSELKKFIGPPLSYTFGTLLGLGEEGGAKAVAFYRQYFAEKGIFENAVYGGICDMLEELMRDGRKLVVATSKPEVYAKRIIAHFDLDRYFPLVCGATLDDSRSQKSDVIAYALGMAGVSPERAVMVGDRAHDIIGAKANGMKCVGVLYGFGDRHELEQAGADEIAEKPSDIALALGRLKNTLKA